jgi:HPt (histidine-containing phosphotransfer) domain-containing protein
MSAPSSNTSLEAAGNSIQSPAVADFNIARQTVDNDRELFDEIVRMFMEDSPALLQGIKEGLTTGNTEIVRRNAHTLKSQVAIFAAERARKLAERVEHSAGQDNCKAAADELEIALLELHSAITTYQW